MPTSDAILTDLLVSALAAWYLAYVVTSTHGPFGVFAAIRNVTTLGGLLECPVCLAFWVALLLVLVPMGIVVQALAIAGLAMLLHGATGWRWER